MTRRVSIMGSTGSIGTAALSFIRHANAQADEPVFAVSVLSAGRNVELLIEQARLFQPDCVVIHDQSCYQTLKQALSHTSIEVAAGADAIRDQSQRPVDRLLAAIVGIDGLASTLAAIEAGNDIALANKESMICAGDLLRSKAAQSGSRIIPTDSEHNAMFQVMERQEDIERLILTASGGPFRLTPLDDLQHVTPKMALAHPRWEMGQKISIDSATLFNKGLELIEAAYLFGIEHKKIEVVVHPQSILHSAIAYRDGSMLAQMGEPDMRTPIAHAMTWPERRQPTPVKPLDLIALGQLNFEALDETKFSAIRLARTALEYGLAMPGILNCANERAVAAFLAGQCRFLDISLSVESVMERFGTGPLKTMAPDSFEAIMAIDAEAERLTGAVLAEYSSSNKKLKGEAKYV